MSQCDFYIERKHRRCGMTCRAGTARCVIHAETTDKRVPCPLDPNHSVWENSLHKHLRKCNKLKQRHLNDGEDFFEEDINTSDADSSLNHSSLNYEESTQDVLDSIALVEQICQDFPEIPIEQKTNEYMETHRMLQLPSNKKHALQQSSLIQHMVDSGMLGPHRVFIEFGCGRAELSRYVNQVEILRGECEEASLPKFLLIDRGTNRMKFDKKFGDDSLELANITSGRSRVRRYRIDIKDLKLAALLEEERTHVTISKHLCGAATDLTLRCLHKSGLQRFGGICIAMCCRHCCDPGEYINGEYIRALLSEHHSQLSYHRFFKSLMKMCSWATCGRRQGMQDEDVGDHFTGLTVSKREELGRMARRILDEGRIKWVKDRGFDARLVKYVEQDISLENVAMLVMPKFIE
ncbi:related to tRNA guanosine-2'-O-methyltransferase TRM13 [Zygosaccharomyces bailii]|nr:related to tRNA guanosine-2'-O-methyltransferase TRM13 [Zygosaccharomyces bailii]